MYGIDENTVERNAYMDAGIHQNVKIVSVVKENSKKDDTGSTVLRFYFENDKGETFNHTEFEIDTENLKKLAKQWNADPKELIKNTFLDLNLRIKHILETFIPKDQIIFKAKGWEDFCDKAVKLCGELYKDTTVRVKLIYNKKDFPIFPKKTFQPFIQNSEENDALKINKKYDRVTPLAPTEENLYGDDEVDGDGSSEGLDDEDFDDEF